MKLDRQTFYLMKLISMVIINPYVYLLSAQKKTATLNDAVLTFGF